jgi:hypothetical protein
MLGKNIFEAEKGVLKMKRNLFVICISMGLFACFLRGGHAQAQQTESIYPLEASGSGVYVTVPFGWLPVPGQPVTVEVHGTTASNVWLVTVGNGDSPVTSNYRGMCTNYGDGTDLDFENPVASDGGGSITLTPKDSGGKAVILVNGMYTFVIPRDDDNDGIADHWEALNCPNGDCVADADIDVGPDPLSPYMGDGLSNFDEYRGFMVGGKIVRGNPMVKDFFIHREETAQCTETQGASFKDVTLSTIFGDDFDSLYANMMNNGVNVHFIYKDEWVDNFGKYDPQLGVIFSSDTTNPGVTDRQINKNALFPPGNGGIVKGVRLVECLDLNQYSPLGLADKFPPDQWWSGNGTAILFVHRILRSLQNGIKAGDPRSIQHFTFQGGKWVWVETFPYTWGNNPTIDDVNVKNFMKKAFAWYAAHEALEHCLDVTATNQGTRNVSYGYHHAEGTGTNVDIKITQVIDKKETGYNKFYIPKSHGISDQREMRNLTDQPSVP